MEEINHLEVSPLRHLFCVCFRHSALSNSSCHHSMLRFVLSARRFDVVAVGFHCCFHVDMLVWLMMLVVVVVVCLKMMTIGIDDVVMVCLYHCPIE